MDELLPERAAAYRALRKWAKAHAERDDVIRAAVAAGVDQRSIQEITGVARSTITRITSGDRVRRADSAGPSGIVTGLVEVGADWLGEQRRESDTFALVSWDDCASKDVLPEVELVKQDD